MPTSVSAIVLTKNEEENLPGCLATLRWADEVLVVDSFSDDRTVEIARQAGVRVIQHPFSNFAAQHNYAQTQAAHDWVLFIDADECVSDELRDEIQSLAQADQLSAYTAYHIQRIHLRSGVWVYTDPAQRKVTPRLRAYIRRTEAPRLVNRRTARWERALHEEVRTPEPRGVLDGVIYHYSDTNLSLGLESFNYYTDLEAAYLHRTRTRIYLLEAVARGARTFIYMYFFLRWFRYGEHGLLMALLAAMTKFTNYAKLWERIRIQNNQGIWTETDRRLLERYQTDN